MLRLTLKNLWSHKGRLFLTTLAVTLGVTFVTSAFVLTDSLNNTFDELAREIAGSLDLQVRGEGYDPQEFDLPPVPLALVDEIEAQPGIDEATPAVGTAVSAVLTDGTEIKQGGFDPPAFGFPYSGPDDVGSITIIEGDGPQTGQVAIDIETVEEFDLEIGDTLQISSLFTPLEEFELVGINEFAVDAFGARYFLFDLPTVQPMAGLPTDQVQTIDIRLEEGAALDTTKSALAAGLPDKIEVVDREEIVKETTESFGEFLDIFRWVLLTFALIALLVSVFVIANTFAIVLGQRIRELGLLRAIGAGTGQVTGSVLLEALVVGIVASVFGLLLGRVVAGLLGQQIAGSGESSVDLVIQSRTLFVALVVGLVVTALAALLPAIRAGRISPMAALREGYSLRSGRSRRLRLIGGAILTVLGVAGVLWAALAGPDDTVPLIVLAVTSALLVIFGVAMLSPTIARPFAGAIGHPAFAIVVLALGVLVAGLAVYGLIQTLDDLWNDPDTLADIRSAMGSQADDLSDSTLRWAMVGQSVAGLVVAGLALWVLSLPLLSFTKPEPRLNVWWRRTIRVLITILLVALVVAGFFYSMSGLGTFAFMLAAALMLLMAGRAGLGIPGRIARGNAMNNPRRTASTATSLMIGLALISTVLVVAESLKASITETLGAAVEADYFVYDDGFQGFSPQLADGLEELPEVEQVGRYRQGQAEVLQDGRSVRVWATTEDGLDGMFDIDVQQGGTAGFDEGGILVHEDSAEDLGLEIGDEVELEFAITEETAEMTVVGIHKDASILENWIIPLEVFDENTVPSQARDSFVALLVAGGIDASRPALEAVLEDYPTVKLENLEEFQASQEGFLDQGLTIINVMLGLAIVIALIGIANTIALSVFQRTRELGLARAVGMNRTQLKQMIRWEAVVIAVFGAVIGMAVGVLFGYTIVTLLPDSVINTWAFPLSEFLVVLAAAVVCGIGAAYLPARRAAQLDILDAIAHE